MRLLSFRASATKSANRKARACSAAPVLRAIANFCLKGGAVVAVAAVAAVLVVGVAVEAPVIATR